MLFCRIRFIVTVYWHGSALAAPGAEDRGGVVCQQHGGGVGLLRPQPPRPPVTRVEVRGDRGVGARVARLPVPGH